MKGEHGTRAAHIEHRDSMGPRLAPGRSPLAGRPWSSRFKPKSPAWALGAPRGTRLAGAGSCPLRTRVLLADDHVLVRQGVRLLLEKEDSRSWARRQRHRGRAAVTASEPECAILDLLMPQLNGIDAAREIHQCSPHTKTLS